MYRDPFSAKAGAERPALQPSTLESPSFHTMGRYPDTLPNDQLEQPDYQPYLDLYHPRFVIRPLAATAGNDTVSWSTCSKSFGFPPEVALTCRGTSFRSCKADVRVEYQSDRSCK